MIYLDYSATTKAEEEVISSFIKCSQKHFANPNASHCLGREAKKLLERASQQVAFLLGVKKEELIYTSGASEANNSAIKSVAETFKNRGKHILSSKFEHPSVLKTLEYLTKKGFEVEYLAHNKEGGIDLSDLKAKLREDTILVSLAAVSSELGIINDLKAVKKILKEYPKCLFHVDMTQAVAKIKIDLEEIDLASFSAHKFYGLKGIGLLYKKDNLKLEPFIHGGDSLSSYRSGTSPTALIVSFSKALRMALEDCDNKYKKVEKYNKFLRKELNRFSLIKINSPKTAVPHILNFSLRGAQAETIQRAFEEEGIYLSTQTACSSEDYSLAVYELSSDMELATSSVRLSLSHKTTEEELKAFIKALEKIHLKVLNLN